MTKNVLITRARRKGTISVTPAGLEHIETLFAAGNDFRTVAKSLGCSGQALQDLRKRDERVAEAWERGLAALSDELAHILLRQARNGNTTAAIFLAKARCGWREGDQPEARPNVTIVLPDAKSEVDYLKVINHGEAHPAGD